MEDVQKNLEKTFKATPDKQRPLAGKTVASKNLGLRAVHAQNMFLAAGANLADAKQADFIIESQIDMMIEMLFVRDHHNNKVVQCQDRVMFVPSNLYFKDDRKQMQAFLEAYALSQGIV